MRWCVVSHQTPTLFDARASWMCVQDVVAPPPPGAPCATQRRPHTCGVVHTPHAPPKVAEAAAAALKGAVEAALARLRAHGCCVRAGDLGCLLGVLHTGDGPAHGRSVKVALQHCSWMLRAARRGCASPMRAWRGSARRSSHATTALPAPAGPTWRLGAAALTSPRPLAAPPAWRRTDGVPFAGGRADAPLLRGRNAGKCLATQWVASTMDMQSTRMRSSQKRPCHS